MLTDKEVMRCEARLGPVALFMPTKPEGEYKLDLRAFADRQIATLLLGEYTIYRIICTRESATGCSGSGVLLGYPPMPNEKTPFSKRSVLYTIGLPVHDTRITPHLVSWHGTY